MASDVEMNESPPGSVMDVTVEEEMQIDEDDMGVDKRFQKDNWRFKFLPYYNELVREADNEFSTVKTLLAKGILERDLRPGFTVAIKSLLEFVNMYGKRFTKTDHIQIVKLLYNVLILKGLDFRVVRMVAAGLNNLMNRKMLITRDDLRVDWKPLYDLYKEIAFKKLEEDGLILFPEGLKEKVEKAIIYLTEFFENGATQEILDLIRPNICPLDDNVTQAFSTASVFLPTCMKPEQHDVFGAKLWFDEFYHWFSCGELNDTNEARILGVLAQLSVDCPFYIDWSDKWDLVFDRLMQSCGLNVSQTALGTDSQGVQLIAILIAYNLGGRDNVLQDKLTSLFQSWEDFFHPSNSGDHLNQLLVFVSKLVTNVTGRVSRERHFQKKHYVRIPEDRCITDAQIDMFVKSLLPCLNYAAFAKTKQDVARIFHYCAFLAPGIVLPQLLDLVYPALENITEPHRLHQTLDIFMQVLVPLARDEPLPGRERLNLKIFEDSGINDKSLRCHFITILNNILPGVDVNDVTKSAMTFQIIATIFCLMPIVDCSEAIHVRNDLTEEEEELCRATAGFESLIDQVLQKCFSIIEANCAACHISNMHPFNMEQVQKTTEEVFNERGVYVVIKQLTKNCSSGIFEFAMNSFFEFIKDRVFDTRTAVDSVCRIMIIFITAKPKIAFPKFFNYAWSKLQVLMSPTTINEEELNHGLLWFLTMTCETLNRVRGDVILEYKDIILPVLEKLLSFTCRDAYLRACSALENVIGMLVSIYPDMDEHYMNVNDESFEKYLPIRNWAKVVKKNEWIMKWHIPSDDEVNFAEELLKKFLFSSLEILQNCEQLPDKQMLKFLHIVQNCVAGASSLLPFFDGEPINFFPHGKPQPVFTCVAMPDYVRRLTGPDGRNLRRIVYNEIKKLTYYILEHKKNDTKSLRVVIQILCNLLVCEGIDPMHYVIKATHHAMRRRIFNDPIKGHMMILETALEEGIYFTHQRRQFHRPIAVLTELHADAMSLLVTLGTSLYADTRVRAQQVLEFCLSQVPYSYKIILDQVLYIIENQRNVSHEEFKGALYILINGKKTSICLKQDWPTLLKVWPTILRAQYSEKTSIIDMFDFIIQTVSQSFESFHISYILPDELMPYALKLLENYDGNVHKAMIEPPNEEEMKKAKEFEEKVNLENLNNYRALCQSLYSICVDRDLHWRHTDMAQSFMALMFRRDIPVPDEIVKLFTRLLVSDTLNTRKSALSVITSWQKIVKIRSVKTIYPINVKLDNVGPGAKWPIKYGLREDNFQLITDMDKELKTPEEYNNTCYFTKWHIGFYTWPKEFKILAPPNEQKIANRNICELSELEKEVLNILSEPGFMEKLIGFYSMEEKKGSDNFVEMNYHLFYRLFRNLGPAIWKLIEPYLDKLLSSKKEGEQRLASEIVSGLLTASKLWKYEYVLPIVNWLQPRLSKCLETVTDEAENNWCASMAIVFCRMDIRQIQWIYNIIVDLVNRSHDNGFHTIFRLKLLHSCIVQYEWRVPKLLREFFRQCVSFSSRNSQILRVRVGSALASCTTPYVYGMHIYEGIPSNLYPIKNADVISVINRELLENVWKEVLTSGFEELEMIWRTELSDKISTILGGNNSPDSPPPLSRSTSIEPVKEDGQLDKNDDIGSGNISTRTGSIGSKTPRMVKSHLRRASTPPVSIPKSGKPEMGRKREKAMLISLANTIYSSWAISSAHQLLPSFELLPLFAHFANDPIDDELSTTCEELLFGEMGCTPVDSVLADHILKVVRLTVMKSCTWKTRCTIIRFLQVHIFANIYIYKNGFVERIREILDILLLDSQLEVRINAGLTISGFIQCGLFTVDADFLNTFNEWSESQDVIRRHAGVLALSAVVTAAPYKVLPYTPDVLMHICRHLRDPQPIYPTVKRTLNEFRRTHLDCWKDHKNQFNEDQLTVLTNLLVSPNYYV